MAHLEECPDVLQTQELQKREDKGWHKTDIYRVTSMYLCVTRSGRTADVPVTTRREREEKQKANIMGNSQWPCSGWEYS